MHYYITTIGVEQITGRGNRLAWPSAWTRCASTLPSQPKFKNLLRVMLKFKERKPIARFANKLVFDFLGCGGTFTSEGGTLIFPQGSGSTTDLNCVFNFETLPEKVIQLNFSYFDLPSTPGCEADALVRN